MPVFEWKITTGNVLEIITIAIGGIFFIWELRSKLVIMQFNQDTFRIQIEKINNTLDNLARATSTMAVQNERISNHAERMNQLEAKIDAIILYSPPPRKRRAPASKYSGDE